MLGFCAVLRLGKPVKMLLESFIIDENVRHLSAGILIRGVMILIVLFLIKRYCFQRFNGIGQGSKIKNLQVIILPVVILSAGFLNETSVYMNLGVNILFLFTFNAIMVALLEEFTFRGLLLPLIIRQAQHKNSVLLIGILLSSLLFGLTHYLNLFVEPDNIAGITSQVIFAMCIGIFLAGLLFRTGSIFLPIFIHLLFNFSFGKGIFRPEIERVVETRMKEGTDWLSLLLNIIFLGFIAGSGIYMLSKVRKEDVLSTLNINEQDL